MSCCGCCGHALPCGCCEGIGIETPVAITNPPGLDALQVRVGTWQSFFDTMVARLSTISVPVSDLDPSAGETRPLRTLATHTVTDFSIALLDAWAVVADVLTFYQERIANEGYLRTATERRSIFELARLVGYRPRPGVAASTYLAFTMETGFDGPIDPGVRVQSLPGPGEVPQSFETSESLEAHFDFNAIPIRARRRQVITDVLGLDASGKLAFEDEKIWLKGVDAKLKVNDALLIQIGNDTVVAPFRVASVTLDNAAKRTGIALAKWPSWDYGTVESALSKLLPPAPGGGGSPPAPAPTSPSTPTTPATPSAAIDSAIGKLFERSLAALPPRSPLDKPTDLRDAFKRNSDVAVRLFTTLYPDLADKVYPAYEGAVPEQTPEFKVFALRVAASLFGAAAPKPFISLTTTTSSGTATATVPSTDDWDLAGLDSGSTNHLYLDNGYERVVADVGTEKQSFVLLEPNHDKDTSPITPTPARLYSIQNVSIFSRSEYGLTGRTTKITLNGSTDWRSEVEIGGDKTLASSRRVMVFTQSELLPLDDVPEKRPLDDTTSEIELDVLVRGLTVGRWLVLTGERADLPDVTDAERVLIGNAEIVGLDGGAGDRLVTKITLANKLAHPYKRDTVVLYGNVVHATHGETKVEVLGGGAPAMAPQAFTLKQAPLTYVSAANERGIDSTLEVRVDGVRWHPIDHIADAGPNDRVYLTRLDDQSKTAVLFGDGTHGELPPTGIENVRATYRVGIGKAGNVRERQISLLATKPLGVKAVINPIAATGGADAESTDSARRNIQIAAMAIDRLVSVQDHADFARRFAGVAKAWAVRESIGGRQVVHVTIAGEDDAPITPDSDLYRNLLDAFGRYGDPTQPVVLDVRERYVLVTSAEVAIDPDASWDVTEPRIRRALQRRFGFDRMQLEENVFTSQIIAVVQSIPGVLGLALSAFGAIDTLGSDGVPLTPSRLASAILETTESWKKSGKSMGAVLGPRTREAPGRLVFFLPTMNETLVLKEVKP